VRKATLREQLTARRKALSAEVVDTRGLKIQARFLATPYYHDARTVALYAPIRGEVPTRDILAAGLADGKVICYPLSHVRGRVLSFRAIHDESELEPGRLGVREPRDSAHLVQVEEIDLFVVPGLGFSPNGKRLGRGGGYYDSTLKAASPRSRRVGLAFAEQIIDDLPTNDDDVDVDLVVTEHEVFRGLFRPVDFAST
jgi:5-formyltetrahydrofolate cyclo-ligase